ncbi:MAG: hypothetical protein LBR66_09645 [Candidatus Symbiothrix sp.]|jgi:Spy/CpxP family protein refolding chaperone|nr:hypothetical protein [Candidatus Symbiothrix sp.]
MKAKVWIMALTGILFSLSAGAQQQPNGEQWRERFEKFKAERAEFITKAIGLTEAESPKFWKIDDEWQQAKFEANRPLREVSRKIWTAQRNKTVVSEADYKEYIELSAKIKIKEAELEQEYLAKMLKLVSAEKVYKYQQAERDFMEHALESRGGGNFGQGQGQGQPQRQQPPPPRQSRQ